MELTIDEKFFFDFKRSGKLNENDPIEWYGSATIDEIEFEFSFKEKLFISNSKLEINWSYVEFFLNEFVKNRKFILEKSHSLLIALNKEIGAWNEEKRKIGIYELVGVEMLANGLMYGWNYKKEEFKTLAFLNSYQLVFKYVGINDENYFIDSPYATWYVNFFNGTVLEGVSRQVS